MSRKNIQKKRNSQIAFILIFAQIISFTMCQQESVQQTFLNKLQMKETETFGGNYHFTTLSLQSSTTSDAVVRFLQGENLALVLALFGKTGSFAIRNSRINIIETFKNNELYFGANYVEFNNSVQVKKNFKIYQQLESENNSKSYIVNQFKEIVEENYWSEPVGWQIASKKNSDEFDNFSKITTCGGVNMLGGYGVLSGKEIKKQFNNLPEHTQLRIIVRYHFIDAWTGEMGYMKLNVGKYKEMVYVWTDKHNANKAKNGINVCGSAAPENKLSQLIDIIHQHTDDSITIAFGSKLDQDPQMSSYGISSLQILVR